MRLKLRRTRTSDSGKHRLAMVPRRPIRDKAHEFEGERNRPPVPCVPYWSRCMASVSLAPGNPPRSSGRTTG